MYRIFIKRLIDLGMAFFVFILFFPLFIALTILLLCSNKGKPFFFQARPGLNENIFKVIKFKTMTDEKDENGVLFPDLDRLTWVGKFIRRTSLDEIPQLLNVIKGDMSLIGPRPLSPKYLKLYNKEQKRRHNVRPGITGWAQINGRNSISWTERFKFDIWYIENISFLLDFKIIIKTVLKVVKTENVVVDGQSSVENFNGNN